MAGSSSIAFTGLASGLDTAKIIDAMLQPDTTRITSLKTQRATVAAQLSMAGQLRSKLSTLNDKLQALRFTSQVLARSATTDTPTGQPQVVSATADSTAATGSFKVTVNTLATATIHKGAVGVGDPSINTMSVGLGTAGLAVTPTAGKFTINGTQIDATGATKFDDFVTAINGQTATTGVQASYVMQAGKPVGVTLQNVGAQVGKPIQVGSSGDTSNFLRAAKLDVATQVGDTLSSTDTLGRLQVGAALASAHFATPPGASGTLTINGVGITWNSGQSVQTVLANINASSANVAAAYDPVANRVVLTSKGTGAQTISVSDTTGNLAQALKIDTASGATEVLGTNASFSVDTINGGAPMSSTSNTVSGIVPGVTLNLLQASATPVTVTVAQDTAGPLAAMKDFVTAFNDTLDFVRTNSKPATDGTRGAFQGDMTVRFLTDRLRNMATSPVSGLTGPYRSLADLGVTTGAVGSSVGTTNSLVIDETKFKAALSANPNAAYDVMNSTTGGQGVFTNLRTYLTSATLPGGLTTSMADTATKREVDIDARIAQQQRLLDTKRASLQARFSRMESALSKLQSQSQRLQAQLATTTTTTKY